MTNYEQLVTSGLLQSFMTDVYEEEWNTIYSWYGIPYGTKVSDWLQQEYIEQDKQYVLLKDVLDVLRYHSNCCGDLDCCADEIRKNMSKLRIFKGEQCRLK